MKGDYMSLKGIGEISDFDFGFSFTEDVIEAKDPVENIETTKQKITELELKLEKLYNSIIPFLDNLCKNPEKDTIFWPNRTEKIQSYKNKLKSIVEGK